MDAEIIVLRLALATFLGGIVGVERERLDRGAGLRTHALVAVGSALFMLVSMFGFTDLLDNEHVNLDPSRVAAQVVSGVGFLGAGTIIQQRASVRGLTTAASVWAVAAIGLAAGGGLYMAAVASTALVLIILIAFRPIEGFLFVRRRPRVITMTIDRDVFSLADLERRIEAMDLRLERLVIRNSERVGHDDLIVVLARTPGHRMTNVVDDFRRQPGVEEVAFGRAYTGDERAL